MKPVTEHETLDHETLPKQLSGASHGTGSESQFLSTGRLFCHDVTMWKRFSIQRPSRLAHHVPNPPPPKRHRPLSCWTACADGVHAELVTVIWCDHNGFHVAPKFMVVLAVPCLSPHPGFSGAVLIHQCLDLFPHSSISQDDEQS